MSRSNLACAHLAAERWELALPALGDLPADRERLLSEDRPDTIVSRPNLAKALGCSGDWDRAITLHETVLDHNLGGVSQVSFDERRDRPVPPGAASGAAIASTGFRNTAYPRPRSGAPRDGRSQGRPAGRVIRRAAVAADGCGAVKVAFRSEQLGCVGVG